MGFFLLNLLCVFLNKGSWFKDRVLWIGNFYVVLFFFLLILQLLLLLLLLVFY